jgi:hypothetical protein
MKKVKFESPTGEEIQCCIRMKRILCIETNFDTFRYIDLAESIAKSKHIDSFVSVGVHEDNSGYWLFRLADEFDKVFLLDDVQVWFNDYFEK